MRKLWTEISVIAALVCAASGAISGVGAAQTAREIESYVPEPMPPGFNVIVNELEGPIFVDAAGKTLYSWPTRSLRNGEAGDRKNTPSNCTDKVERVSSGLMSPYPGGLVMPDVDERPSCQAVWPPVLAPSTAQELGKWSVIERRDGAKQWAYDGYPLYTSVLDVRAGDVLGGSNRKIGGGDEPAIRKPVAPRSNVPPAFAVRQVGRGRMIVMQNGYSVYSWDGDGANASNCVKECLAKWTPVPAGKAAQPNGEWTVFERSQGVRQWAFRGRPLYTYNDDPKLRSQIGSDEPGWHNVYTMHAPAVPAGFTERDSHAGIVLADEHGQTIYLYSCGDDALDQLACDHPTTPQQFRLAVCGGGDAARCLKTWRYVPARADAKSPNRIWTTIDIDPTTGRIAVQGQAGAMHVWAYRGRPVYTYFNDKPGDVNGDALGEFYGTRNGFKAFWLRDDFYNNAG
ncbi:MAG: hypothetical protein AB7H70_13180 [Rhodospirillaceae bacterium]